MNAVFLGKLLLLSYHFPKHRIPLSQFSYSVAGVSGKVKHSTMGKRLGGKPVPGLWLLPQNRGADGTVWVAVVKREVRTDRAICFLIGTFKIVAL